MVGKTEDQDFRVENNLEAHLLKQKGGDSGRSNLWAKTKTIGSRPRLVVPHTSVNLSAGRGTISTMRKAERVGARLKMRTMWIRVARTQTRTGKWMNMSTGMERGLVGHYITSKVHLDEGVNHSRSGYSYPLCAFFFTPHSLLSTLHFQHFPFDCSSPTFHFLHSCLYFVIILFPFLFACGFSDAYCLIRFARFFFLFSCTDHVGQCILLINRCIFFLTHTKLHKFPCRKWILAIVYIDIEDQSSQQLLILFKTVVLVWFEGF